MTAIEVLDRVLRAGGRVVAGKDGPWLRYPSEFRALVLERRGELRELLLEAALDPQAPNLGPLVAHVLSQNLDQFQFEGFSVEIAVSWTTERLWLSPDEGHAAALVARGVARGHIFTVNELIELLAVGDSPPPAWSLIASAKTAISGRVVGVWPNLPATVARAVSQDQDPPLVV
jgi:hypothetical protein